MMVAVESVEIVTCPSCEGDPTGPCDRCDGQRQIAKVSPSQSTQQVIAEGLRRIREKLQ